MPPKKRVAVKMPPKKRHIDGDDENGGEKKKRKQNKMQHSKAIVSQRHTRFMTTDAARQAVFLTSEILENILLRLPIKNIISSQRVCRKFRDMVTDTRTIRQKLFLVPLLKDDKVWELDKGPGSSKTFRPVAATAHINLNNELQDSTSAGASQVLRVKPAQLNPVFGARVDLGREAGRRLFRDTWKDAVEHSWGTSAAKIRYRDLQFFGPSSAYITDPPCTKVEIKLSWAMHARAGRMVSGDASYHISDPSGVTFKHFWNAMQNDRQDLEFSAVFIPTYSETIEDVTFPELQAFWMSEGFNPAVFKLSDMHLKLYGVAIPSDEEWESVGSYKPEQ